VGKDEPLSSTCPHEASPVAAEFTLEMLPWPSRDAGPGEFIGSGGIELRCFGSNFD
jgi:hypothetical protein